MDKNILLRQNQRFDMSMCGLRVKQIWLILVRIVIYSLSKSTLIQTIVKILKFTNACSINVLTTNLTKAQHSDKQVFRECQILQSPRHYVYKYMYIIYLLLNNIVYSLSQPSTS